MVLFGSNLDRPEPDIVKLFSLDDNVWRTIDGFPVLPLQFYFGHEYDGVQLSCTINWMAFQTVFGRDDIIEEYVIISEPSWSYTFSAVSVFVLIKILTAFLMSINDSSLETFLTTYCEKFNY